jgi:hypothetical protein
MNWRILENRKMQMQHANWIAQARAHWMEHQPTMYNRLRREGKLDKALTEAADETAKEIRTLMLQGATWQEAWEQTRELYLFPPDEPGLEEEPMPLSQGYLAQRELMQAMNDFDPNSTED